MNTSKILLLKLKLGQTEVFGTNYDLERLYDSRHLEWQNALINEYYHVLKEYDLPLVPASIYVFRQEAPPLQPGNNIRLGEWDSETREIGINSVLIDDWEKATGILRHEIAHQIVNEISGMSRSHEIALFKYACELIEVPRWARKDGHKHEVR